MAEHMLFNLVCGRYYVAYVYTLAVMANGRFASQLHEYIGCGYSKCYHMFEAHLLLP